MKKTVEKNTVQNKSISAPSSGVTKKGQKSRSAVSFGDRPLYVDVIPGGSLGTLWTPEGRHLADFLRWSTSFKSVGRSKEFAGCVHALLTRDLAVSFLKKNYPELCRDKHFEDVLGKFERKVMKINEDYVNMDINMSKVASKLCDAYHKTFGDYEFADDDQAQDVTRLIRYHNVYYKMDKSHKKLLDDVFPEISSDDDEEDDDEEDDDEEDDDQTPDSVADFVMRYVRKIKTIGYLRVRDVIGSVDSEHAVNYLKSYEKFIQEPFTFTEL
jgi:hypothetical protein